MLVRGNGTSFAAPHVTGAAALCLEAAGFRLSAAQLRALVLDSCDPPPDADPDCRYGHGYLNIPRLAADVRRALAAPAGTPATKEATMAMATEDTTVLLAAGAATAYREYLYRPDGQLARTIGEHFELVAGPGQRLSRAPQPGDVLLEVTLGHPGHGRCVPLDGAELILVAGRPRLAVGPAAAAAPAARGAGRPVARRAGAGHRQPRPGLHAGSGTGRRRVLDPGAGSSRAAGHRARDAAPVARRDAPGHGADLERHGAARAT